MKTILLVEDEQKLREIIKDYFEEEKFNVIEAEDGFQAIQIFNKTDVDLVILDIMMPKLDGWSVCKRIRNKSDVLIIMLTARDDEEDKLLGFELGADEYVTKPFSPKVLVARAKKLINRFEKTNNVTNVEIIKKNEITIDKNAYSVKVEDREIRLAQKEYELLLLLVENEGKVFSRDSILDSLWNYEYYGDGRVVDTYIKNIRKKLGNYSNYISTVIGVGYKFEVKE